jgi:hypothetical protein
MVDRDILFIGQNLVGWEKKKADKIAGKERNKVKTIDPTSALNLN